MANRKMIEAVILRTEDLEKSLDSRAKKGDYQEIRRLTLSQ
jgi:hypothetical protein